MWKGEAKASPFFVGIGRSTHGVDLPMRVSIARVSAFQ